MLDKKVKRILKIAVVLIALIIIFPAVINLFTEGLWYSDLGYLDVYTKELLMQAAVVLICGALTFGFIFFNLRKAINGMGSDRITKLISLGISLFIAFIFAMNAKGMWFDILQFLNKSKFNSLDPIFGKDISFYIFSLPLMSTIYNGILALLIVTILLVTIGYIVKYGVKRGMSGFKYESMRNFVNAKDKLWLSGLIDLGMTHLIALISCTILLGIFGKILRIFSLVNSPSGLIYGAGYSDVKAVVPSTIIMIVLSVVVVVVAFMFSAKKKVKPVVITYVAFAVASLVFGAFIPSFVENIYVEPNQLEAEEKYIGYNLDFTRKAFGLSNVIEGAFEYDDQLTSAELQKEALTVENVRLWDWQPLLSTYSQLQEMRLYYKFNDMDIDRYIINGAEKQVMIAAREMDVTNLPADAKNWINQHLKYTHGYGVVASPVNEIGLDGLPAFLLKDIPPAGISELQIDRPEIYFGERTDNYVIVKTKTDEFNYPVGDTNSYSRYEGNGGVKLSNFFIRAAYAIKFGTMKIILSSDITKDSVVMYDRSIADRVKKIAPFLKYDSDPYIVVSDGRLIWMIDAYTTSNNFPYSQSARVNWNGTIESVNYIRNSVKITVDAYTGETMFYIVGEDDPVILTYAKIFPKLFISISQMPDSLKEHIRYPEDMFDIQTKVYASYHMKESAIFYNKEDYWAIPNEIYGDRKTELSPYYINMSLPGEDDFGFVLIMPFTPISKDNMVAWLAAKCDWNDYGKMVIYKFSKQRTIYGPMQVEAQIDQDSEISKLLSLWNQNGSNVIRGNMMVYPIGNSFLFVEPLFLAAERSQMPQLKLVLVSDGSRVTMGEHLNEALSNLVGYRSPSTNASTLEGGTLENNVSSFEVQELAELAYSLYMQSKESIALGDWAGYGTLQEELERVLEELNKR